MSQRDKLKDLGLTYDQAMHGVQTDIAFRMSRGAKTTEPKHVRVGVDMSKADMLGLVTLLIDKGVFTLDEYVEAVRLSANNEVAMRDAELERELGIKMTLR